MRPESVRRLARAAGVVASLVLCTAAHAAAQGFATVGHTVLIGAGSGYTDVSPKQIVRTSTNIVYLVAANCDAYPCEAATQTVRVWRANNTGIPTAFTRMDAAHEPVNAGSVAAAIDGSNVIHIAWQDRNGTANTRIRFATFNTGTGTWSVPEDLESNVGAADDAGQGDSFVSLALDSTGKPHAAYLFHDGTRRRLAYRNRTAGAWSARLLIDDNAYGANEKAWVPNIAFDTAGRRVFAWLTGAFNEDRNGVIRVRVMDVDGTLGTRADVSSTTAKVGIDQSTSLLCDGKIHITWILGGTPGTEYVRYAYATEGKNPVFTQNNPANADTHDPSLGPGLNGAVRIYGHGSEATDDNSLYYWEGTGGSGAWSGRVPFAAGAFDGSVSTRWSQYFQNFPLNVDIVYWDQNYPNNLYYGGDAGTGCGATLSPSGASFTYQGGSGTIAVTAQAGCSWTAQSGAAWLVVTSGGTGSGSGSVGYTASGNSTTSDRTGSITIAGVPFTVTEAKVPAPRPAANLLVKP